MEPIQKHLQDLSVEKVPEPACLPRSFAVTSASDEENKMIQLKYASRQIGAMQPEELIKWSKALLMKIHVITGWVIPADQALLNILKDQFQKKLQEDYEMLNTDEIEYAFRSTGTTIEDWGKEMNLNLVDKVLQPYVRKRLDVSAVEEKTKATPVKQKIYTDEEILNERRGEVEAAYQAMRKGCVPIMFDYFAEVLVLDGFIHEACYMNEFFVQALGRHLTHLYIRE